MYVRFVEYNQVFENESSEKIDLKKFPFNLDIFNFFKSGGKLEFEKSVNFFVGENGAGKTTFIESLAFNLGLNKFGGSKNFVLDKKKEPVFSNYIRLVKSEKVFGDAFFFRAENFFDLQSEIDSYGGSHNYFDFEDGKANFREMSHGQGFKSFFENRLGDSGVYIFDEPESALSVESQIEFLFLLKELSRLDNQIFIVTHSPIILSFPDADIFDVDLNFERVKYKNSSQFNDYLNFFKNVNLYRDKLKFN